MKIVWLNWNALRPSPLVLPIKFSTRYLIVFAAATLFNLLWMRHFLLLLRSIEARPNSGEAQTESNIRRNVISAVCMGPRWWRHATKIVLLPLKVIDNCVFNMILFSNINYCRNVVFGPGVESSAFGAVVNGSTYLQLWSFLLLCFEVSRLKPDSLLGESN